MTPSPDHHGPRRISGLKPAADGPERDSHGRPRHAAPLSPARRRPLRAGGRQAAEASRREPPPAKRHGRAYRFGMQVVRLWLPSAIVLSGFIVLAVRRDETGLEGWAMLVGAGLSVWLLNFFFRMAVSGDRDREDEEEARRYLDEHGHWPGER